MYKKKGTFAEIKQKSLFHSHCQCLPVSIDAIDTYFYKRSVVLLMMNWQRQCRRVGAAVVVLALVLRLGGDSRVAEAAEWMAPGLYYLYSGQRPAAGETTVPDTTTAPAPTEPETVPTEPRELLTFSAAELSGIGLRNSSSYTPNLEALLTQEVSLDFSGEAPRVLIVHTHGTEAYTMEEGWEYDNGGTFARTSDTDYNMVRVGEVLAAVLEEAGISVIHDKTLNDLPSYNNSYNRSRELIEDYLEQYPSIVMVIDVHRDAIGVDSSTPVTCTIDGEETAQLMLVVGTNEGGLYHPNWEQNLSWALKLQAVGNRMYPGLFRDMSLRTARFNQHATPGSILVEVGAAGNTLQQALRGAEYLGEVIVETIQGLGLD